MSFRYNSGYTLRPHSGRLASIEKIGLDLSGLMQNGADHDEARLLGVKHRMSLKAEATKPGRDRLHNPPDTGKAGEQVERALQYRPSKKGDTSSLFEVSDSRDEAWPRRDSRFSAIGY